LRSILSTTFKGLLGLAVSSIGNKAEYLGRLWGHQTAETYNQLVSHILPDLASFKSEYPKLYARIEMQEAQGFYSIVTAGDLKERVKDVQNWEELSNACFGFGEALQIIGLVYLVYQGVRLAALSYRKWGNQ
jgi:hypothetical protein